MPLYYISAEKYSKKMQAASMPNAIAFVAHRSRLRLPSKPYGFVVNHAILLIAIILRVLPRVLFIYLPFWSVHRHT